MMEEMQRVEPRELPGYSLASPEFFHLLQRIEQAESVLRQEIERTESALRQEMKHEIGSLRQEIGTLRQEMKHETGTLRQEIKQELSGVRTLILATLALVVGTLGVVLANIARL